MQIEEAIEKIKELLNLTNWYPEYGYKEAIETVINYVKMMHSELDRLEGIEDDTTMLKLELIEAKEHNRQLGLEIARLNNRCKKLDREAQSYLEEMVGDEGLKERTIKGLELEIEQKDKTIDLLANDLRYYEGMGQNDLFCFDICNHCEYCDKELCKERIKEFYMKKASEEDDAVGR